MSSQVLLIVLAAATAACTLDCGGRRSPSRATPASDPSADPSAQITLRSAAQPSRNGSDNDLGHAVTEKLLTPVSDCDLALCAGDPSPKLIGIVRSRATQARACYEEALKSAPTLAGRLLLRIRVTHDGHACQLQISNNELTTSKTIVPCLRQVMEQNYPSPKGGCVDLNLPLKFVPEYFEADAGTASDVPHQ